MESEVFLARRGASSAVQFPALTLPLSVVFDRPRLPSIKIVSGHWDKPKQTEHLWPWLVVVAIKHILLSQRKGETTWNGTSPNLHPLEPRANSLAQHLGVLLARTILVKPIGEDLVADTRILRFHVTSSLSRNPVFQLLFDISKEPTGLGNCVLTTVLARLGSHSFLFFFHIPVGGCKDPSICNVAMGRFRVARLRRQ